MIPTLNGIISLITRFFQDLYPFFNLRSTDDAVHSVPFRQSSASFSLCQAKHPEIVKVVHIPVCSISSLPMAVDRYLYQALSKSKVPGQMKLMCLMNSLNAPV